jgi:hypothetical protein
MLILENPVHPVSNYLLLPRLLPEEGQFAVVTLRL